MRLGQDSLIKPGAITEVMVDRGYVHACPRSDLLARSLRKPSLGNQMASRFQDGLAGGHPI